MNQTGAMSTRLSCQQDRSSCHTRCYLNLTGYYVNKVAMSTGQVDLSRKGDRSDDGQGVTMATHRLAGCSLLTQKTDRLSRKPENRK